MIELFLRQRLALLRADKGLSARELSLRLGQSEKQNDWTGSHSKVFYLL